MVQSLVVKDGKLLLLPDKLAVTDGDPCECCDPNAPVCLCGPSQALDGAFGFLLYLTPWVGGPTYPYCTANRLGFPIPEPFGGWPDPMPNNIWPGLPDPAFGRDSNHTQRLAVCDDNTKFGNYRIDTLCQFCGLSLKIYFSIANCTTGGIEVIGWEHAQCIGPNNNLIQYHSITAGVACDWEAP